MRFRGQNIVNVFILLASAILGTMVVTGGQQSSIVAGFFVIALVLGLTMTLPIGGGDMPVVISLYNALTGLAVAFEGFVMNNAAMIIAGTVVGAAGTLLTQLMAKAIELPGYQVTVDLEACRVTDAEDFSHPFTVHNVPAVHEFRRDCLLRGLDDIGLALEHEADIRAYEAARAMR